MNATFACPRCDKTVRIEVADGADAIACPACRAVLDVPNDAFDDGRLEKCLVCPSTDLFVRKDFPQYLGVGIVVFGFAVSCVTWHYYLTYWTFAVLFATALVDVMLWFVVPNCLTCYRCDAQYRGLPDLQSYESFNLETHERYRQQAIRLKQLTR